MEASGDQGKKRKFSPTSSGENKSAAPTGPGARPFRPPPKQSKPVKSKEGKKAKKNTPKKKRKAKKEKKVDRTRDFAGDLDDYLEQWEEKDSEGNAWKFNKILQAWALDNCYNKKKVDAALFKRLIPYLLTVQGGAMDRLSSRAAAILSTDKSDIVDDDQEVAPPVNGGDDIVEEKPEESGSEDEDGAKKKAEIITKSMASRAKKIQKALNA